MHQTPDEIIADAEFHIRRYTANLWDCEDCQDCNPHEIERYNSQRDVWLLIRELAVEVKRLQSVEPD